MGHGSEKVGHLTSKLFSKSIPGRSERQEFDKKDAIPNDMACEEMLALSPGINSNAVDQPHDQDSE